MQHSSDGSSRTRIILVEDEVPVLGAMGKILQNNDYEVRCFDSCGKALEYLSQADELERCDILVTDVCMPTMSGAELGRLVRAARPDLPILYCSGKDLHELEGIEHHNLITKPFSVHELIARIDSMLAQQQATHGGH